MLIVRQKFHRLQEIWSTRFARFESSKIVYNDVSCPDVPFTCFKDSQCGDIFRLDLGTRCHSLYPERPSSRLHCFDIGRADP
jgi:hypothetical protein